MTPLHVQGLEKHYPGFSLTDMSFDLRSGRITGLIGRNGAGKTTTLRSILGFLHRDAGEIRFWDEELDKAKHRIGYVGGGVRFYPTKKLKTITDVTRGFYVNWDADIYRRLMSQFSLDEMKTPKQLSEGMKVKYALVLALSHRAELLILDEPTSGLDPVSRDELLELFLELRDQGTTILFSTHITSDLEHCADDLLYIRQGKLLAADTLKEFAEAWRLVHFEDRPVDTQGLVGIRRERDGYTALIPANDAGRYPSEETDLETIMVHLEREAEI